MNPDDLWKELAATALLGTERRGFAPPAAPGELGGVLSGLVGREPETALMGTVATLSLYRRAGRRPAVDLSPIPEPAERDERPTCGPIAAGYLAQILSGEYSELLEEGLTALHASGRRAPEELLPDLLDRGRANRPLRPKVRAVLGRRGHWLAARNPDWSYAVAVEAPSDTPASDELWQTGIKIERLLLLQRIRASDPARGRELAASTWSAEEPEFRAGILEAFEINLSVEDEPFLETALDDRRKEVRAAAAELLTRRPEFGLVRRMIARAAPALGLSEPVTNALIAGQAVPSPLKEEPFAKIALPKECDKGMIRDGLEPKPRVSKIGERAWWLYQLISRIPPSLWCQSWGRTPTELVQAALQCKWRDVLYPAFAEAAARHEDADWIEALLPHHLLAKAELDLPELLGALPSQRREALVLELIRRDKTGASQAFRDEPLDDDHHELLEHVPPPWGDELSREVLHRLERRMTKAKSYDYMISYFLKTAGRALPPALALRATASWSRDDSSYHEREYVHKFLALLQFRHDMLKEFSA
jgi:hypothetical protein